MSSSHRRTRFIWAGVVLALLTLVFLRLYVLQVARAAGMAMAPTIVDHDRLVVDKLTYRFTDPPAGDIVMMRYPPNPERRFVMRVIAGENERVELRAGRVYVNDQPIDDSYVASEARSTTTGDRKSCRGATISCSATAATTPRTAVTGASCRGRISPGAWPRGGGR